MKKLKLIIISLLIFSLFCLIGNFIYFIGMTTPGLSVVINQVSHQLPGKLHIQKIEGKLFSNFTLKNISYFDSKKYIEINELHVSWLPKFLLKNRVVLNQLSLNHLKIQIKESNERDNSLSLQKFGWLKKIIIQQAEIQDIIMNGRVNGLPIKGTANISFSHNRFEIKHTQLFIADSMINLTGSADNKCDLSGNITIPKLGIKLEQIKLNISFDKNNIKINGGFESDKGNALIEGTLDLSKFSIKLHLKGQNLQLINLPDYKINFTPDMILTMNPSETNLQGEIEIPYAEIIGNHYADSITLSDDVIFEGSTETLNSSSLLKNISMDLHLKITDRVKLIYKDLVATLNGNLLLTQRIGSAPIVSGELSTIKGTYSTYGQILDLQKGSRLTFAGSTLTNPGLDIRAIKHVKRITMNHPSLFSTQILPSYTGTEPITVGVQISGTLNQSSISLFSVPGDLSQTDILSYLLFGKPQSQVTDASMSSLLTSTTLSMLSSQSPVLSKTTKKLQRWLNEIDIDTETIETLNPKTNSLTPSTTFGIGKQLARNLYLHYSTGNGVDLMYGFEFD